MKDMKAEETKNQAQTLSRGMRFALFLVLVSVEMAMNWSSGLLSSASKDIKVTLQINDAQFGMFGTASGIGRVIGTFIYIAIVNSTSRKWSFAVFTIMKSVFLFMFNCTTNGWMLITTRGLIGIAHMPPSIYIPVWIDQFGIQKYKTVFMTSVQVLIPIGKVTGYALHILFGEPNWQRGFVFEGFYLLLCGLFVAFTPDKFFSPRLTVVADDHGNERVEVKEKRGSTLFLARQSVKKEEEKTNVVLEVRECFSSPVFSSALVVRAFLLGVNTALHFWISDYMRNVLMISDKTVIFNSYIIIAIAGPLGGIVANSIVSACLGGYEHKHSAMFLLALHLCTVSFGIAMTFMHDLIPFCVCTAMFLVFSSSAIPFIQGIVINSVRPGLKGMAFSVADLFSVLFTSGTSPFIYGYINDRYKHIYPSLAMLCIMSIGLFTILQILVLAYFRYKSYKDKDEKLIDSKEAPNENAKGFAQSSNEEGIELAKK